MKQKGTKEVGNKGIKYWNEKRKLIIAKCLLWGAFTYTTISYKQSYSRKGLGQVEVW